MITIYLAGPILNESSSEMKLWRNQIRNLLFNNNITFLDPTQRETSDINYIIKSDKSDIDQCDVIIADCRKPSSGTSMEIYYAWKKGKFIIIYSNSVVSPWIVYHSNCVVNSIENIIVILKDKYETIKY